MPPVLGRGRRRTSEDKGWCRYTFVRRGMAAGRCVEPMNAASPFGTGNARKCILGFRPEISCGLSCLKECEQAPTLDGLWYVPVVHLISARRSDDRPGSMRGTVSPFTATTAIVIRKETRMQHPFPPPKPPEKKRLVPPRSEDTGLPQAAFCEHCKVGITFWQV